MNVGVAIALAAAGALASDSMWYEIGRRKGVRVLQLALPDFAGAGLLRAQNAESFTRNGPQVLLGAKFIPGLNAMAAPLSGIIQHGLAEVSVV